MLVTLQQYNTDIYKLTTSFDLTSYDINSVDGGGETQNYQSYTPPQTKAKLCNVLAEPFLADIQTQSPPFSFKNPRANNTKKNS